jgi:hypothetical protein
MADRLTMFVPLTKVNVEKREVWGTATQEVVDGHKEILDYASSAPNFHKWSVEVEKRSKGKSKGNLREMHQPVAAGKLIAIDFDDSSKKIDIGTFISDDQAWRKVMDGTYTGFSIGGDYAKRWMDSQHAGVTRYTADPHEISLVDAPAVPTAVFEMIKSDGSTELRKFLTKDEGSEGAPALEIEIEVEIGQGTETETPLEEPLPLTTVLVETPELTVEPLEDNLIDNPEDVQKSHILEPGKEAEDVAIEQGVTDGAQPAIEDEIAEVLSDASVTEIQSANFTAPADKVREISPELEAAPVSKSALPEWFDNWAETVHLLKGGSGSGNFGHSGRAGVRGGSGGGGMVGSGGGGNPLKVATAATSKASDLLDDAEKANEAGAPQKAVASANKAYDSVDEAINNVELDDDDDFKVENLRTKVERSLDRTEQAIASGDRQGASRNLAVAIDAVYRIIDTVSGYINKTHPSGDMQKSNPDWLGKFKSAVVELQKQAEVPNEKVIAELRQRGVRVGISRREGAPLTSPDNLPLEKYADPANFLYPIANRAQARAALVGYNLRKEKGEYTDREWSVLGRRIARMASNEFGVTYQFNPTAKTVAKAIQENNMATKDMAKAADPMGLLRDVAAGLNEACKLVGSDPSAAKDLLMQMVSAMDVSADVAEVNPSSNSLPVAKEGGAEPAGVPETPPMAAAGPAAEPEMAKDEPAAEPEVAKAEPVPAEAEFSKQLTAMMELMKMQAEASNAVIEKLTEKVGVLEKAQAEADELVIPIGDLNALTKDMTSSDTSLIDALNAGDLAKAFSAVGNDTMKLYEQVNDLAVRQIAITGINVQRYGFFPSTEPIFPDPSA